MWWVLPLVLVAGCGRLSFEPVGDDGDVSIGHDEDGDGIADADDPCPCTAGSRLDGDRDGVGDDCDPNPGVSRDTLAVFGTMAPGDQPFVVFPDDGSDPGATWTQRPDALEFDGPPDASDQHLSGHLELPMLLGDVRITLGFDIVNRIEPGDQFQIAVGVRPGDFQTYYTELNEVPPNFRAAQVLKWNGSAFETYAMQDLVVPMHAGFVTYQATYRLGVGGVLDAGWPGEPYHLETTDGQYQGGEKFEININDLHLQIRYVCVITSS
jgi:hypothetical protein